jgi:allantoicase
VRGVDVDTNHFKGNFPEACSIDARSDGGEWVEILPKSALEGHAQNLFEIRDGRLWSHVRLNIHPDGGVARLRVYGEVVPAPLAGTIDLASVRNGGVVIAASDEFFGSRRNLILPGDAIDMGDGWETRRRRGPGHDWVVVRLAAEGTPERAEVDTSHFKGNYPGSCWLEGSQTADGSWTSLLARSELGPDRRQTFEVQPVACRFVRFNIHPDGGVARLRLWGSLSAAGFVEARTRCLDALPLDAAIGHLLRICASRRWAERVAARRPFGDPDALLGAADAVWREVGPEDWLEAFRAHPRIGEKGTGWSQKEQAGAHQASAATLAELAALNAAYEARFGHVFLICASGKTADQMLADLRKRMNNPPDVELRVAAEAQREITHLRLRLMP